MKQVSTTVIAVTGKRSRELLERVREAGCLRTVLPELDAPPLERASSVWDVAAGSHTPYLLHDADPLAAVADAWARLFDQQGPVGELEVALQQTLQRWRAGSIELPDYYLVSDAETMDATRRHWYLGFLHRAAPVRVVPVTGSAATLTDQVGRLPTGRWWPELDRLLDGVERVTPDTP
jgi:hypothetical protein